MILKCDYYVLVSMANYDQQVNDLINQIVDVCRGQFNELQLVLLLGVIDLYTGNYPNRQQIVLNMKRWFETRFNQLANAAMGNHGFNAENVATVKRLFHENYGEWLDVRLPSDNVGSAMTILHSLHARLAALERLHTSSQ